MYLVITNLGHQVYWLLVCAFWGTLRLVELREIRPQGEDKWGFGQVVACALFLAPILALLDAGTKTLKRGGSQPGSPQAGIATISPPFYSV